MVNTIPGCTTWLRKIRACCLLHLQYCHYHRRHQLVRSLMATLSAKMVSVTSFPSLAVMNMNCSFAHVATTYIISLLMPTVALSLRRRWHALKRRPDLDNCSCLMMSTINHDHSKVTRNCSPVMFANGQVLPRNSASHVRGRSSFATGINAQVRTCQ